MATVIEIEYFNSYIIKSLQSESTSVIPTYPGVSFPGSCVRTVGNTYANNLQEPSQNFGGPWNFYVEESRIRGGYNNVSTDFGVRAYLDEPFPQQQRRINTLIYSGVYNSRTGVNETNVFSISESITKSIDPIFGSIQKLYSEDTNLIVFQENKIHRALIDKDTIYTTESGTQTQAAKTVIGQFVPYKGEYGISKNPESFAIYNYRKYFTDRNRNAVMRLSNDGLTEISMYGMQDYFRDNLALITGEETTTTLNGVLTDGGQDYQAWASFSNGIYDSDGDDAYLTPGMTIVGQFNPGGYITRVEPNYGTYGYTIWYSQEFNPDPAGTVQFQFQSKGRIVGGWDIHNKNYVLSLQKTSTQADTNNNLEASYNTVAFDEKINGWVSFYNFKPNQMFSVLNNFYSISNIRDGIGSEEIKMYKHYYNDSNNNTRGKFYNTRHPSNVTFVINPRSSVMKNFQTIHYEGSNGWEVTSFKSGFTGFDPNPNGTSTYVQNQDVVNVVIKSYDEGLYTDTITGQPLRAGFDRKENRYVTNLISNSAIRAGEIIAGNQISGIKGYFATITIETDSTTQLGGPKELWAAGSKYVVSSM
mgnify:FL=1